MSYFKDAEQNASYTQFKIKPEFTRLVTCTASEQKKNTFLEPAQKMATRKKNCSSIHLLEIIVQNRKALITCKISVNTMLLLSLPAICPHRNVDDSKGTYNSVALLI